MRNLITLAVLLVAAFVVAGLIYGWIEYRRSPDTTTIDIHTTEIRKDVSEAADKAIDAGKMVVDDAEESLESASDELQQEPGEPDSEASEAAASNPKSP